MRITDLARRAARYEWLERRLFEVVGRWTLDEHDRDALRQFATEARHHAWRAEMWTDVAPVLHDVDRTSLDAPPAAVEALDALASLSTTIERVAALADVILPGLLEAYESQLATADPVSDAPVIRVLQLLSLDAKQDWGAAAQLRHSVVRTEEDKERAAATQSWLEVLLVPCWEV